MMPSLMPSKRKSGRRAPTRILSKASQHDKSKNQTSGMKGNSDVGGEKNRKAKQRPPPGSCSLDGGKILTERKDATRRSTRRWNEFIEEAEGSGLLRGKDQYYGSDSWRNILASDSKTKKVVTGETNDDKGNKSEATSDKTTKPQVHSRGGLRRFKFKSLKPDVNFHSVVEFVGNRTRRRLSSTKVYKEFEVNDNESDNSGNEHEDDENRQNSKNEWNDAAQRLMALQLDSSSPNSVAALFNPQYTELPHTLAPLSKEEEGTSETFLQDSEKGRPEVVPKQDVRRRPRRSAKSSGSSRRRSAKSSSLEIASAEMDPGSSTTIHTHPTHGEDTKKTDPRSGKSQRPRSLSSIPSHTTAADDSKKIGTRSGRSHRPQSLSAIPSYPASTEETEMNDARNDKGRRPETSIPETEKDESRSDKGHRRSQRPRKRPSTKTKEHRRHSDPQPTNPENMNESGNVRGHSMPELPSSETDKKEEQDTKSSMLYDIESVPSEDDTIDSQTECFQFDPALK